MYGGVDFMHVHVLSMTHVCMYKYEAEISSKEYISTIKGMKCDLQMYLRTYIPVFFAD